jgi:hypothetical protein
MFRLRYVTVLMTNAVITGGLLIFIFSMGWYGYGPVIVTVVIGFALSWVAAKMVARKIKDDDPGWNAEKDRPVPAEIEQRRAQPDPVAPTTPVK